MLFFLTAWLIVLMPFLFWWSTWFGRHLTDQQITEYLSDAKHPRHIQHALVQLGERMGRHDAGAARWYADLVRLASYPVEEVRNTDAWVMGQDTSHAAGRLFPIGARKCGAISGALRRRIGPRSNCRFVAAGGYYGTFSGCGK
jgi:hypothetical protein